VLISILDVVIVLDVIHVLMIKKSGRAHRVILS